MRESDRPAWQRLRGRLRERGIDPSDAAVADISVHEPDPQNPVWLVVRGLGRIIVSYSPIYDSFHDIDARWGWTGDDPVHVQVRVAEAILSAEHPSAGTEE